MVMDFFLPIPDMRMFPTFFSSYGFGSLAVADMR